jgi:4-hydroxybenzoate polyprenyltransferase/phosphoserine phosphatase
MEPALAPAAPATSDRSPGRASVPLCVDLDETLIRTDILWESVVQLWRNPLTACRALLALLRHGKAGFKTVLAEAVTIDPRTLPYHQEVLDFARAQRALGRDVVLATATHRLVAQRIADHLGLFCRVFATDGAVNLSEARKRAALESCYGARGFDYVGDHDKDLAVFRAAREALLVNPSASLLARASAVGNVARVFSDSQPRLPLLARAVRLHQWAKNVLVVVPLLAAHRVLELDAWASVLIAFVAFGLVASATYLMNDLVDLNADRLHAQKRFRPLASGQLAIPWALLLGMGFAACGFGIAAALLPSAFVAYLLVYMLLTLAYSLHLKRRLLVDVLSLSVLYTLRVLAGGAAIGVVVSEWLLMFSLFVFLSLAFVKRVDELQATQGSGKLAGRGYLQADTEVIRTIGVSSGLMAVLILALYIGSTAVAPLYRSPAILWLICPLLAYWIARIWVLAARGHIRHDPVVFLLLDWRSYVTGAIGVGIILLAKLAPPGFHW